ncbi:hypothetical protein ILUMI_08691 [Ignelater luminosus]|uniref:Uncharacterized protein n=1 Tax=Ignelater luminosus TaxID=2038154 RepID=A0A8K0GD63_IGNLU|nr:hypothetical protein ILUMI_08691 [Ignelater luminosus]
MGNLKKAVLEIGRKRRYRKRIGLRKWTPELENAIQDKRVTYKKYINNPTDKNKEDYKQKRNYKKMCMNGKPWTLNKNEKDTVQINPTDEQDWIKYYKDLWFREDAEETNIEPNNSRGLDFD